MLTREEWQFDEIQSSADRLKKVGRRLAILERNKYHPKIGGHVLTPYFRKVRYVNMWTLMIGLDGQFG